MLTICEYLRTNEEEYSQFISLLEEGDLLVTLCGYNPHGENYTLFLPTNDAVNRFIAQNENYTHFDSLLQDTVFIRKFVRYHTVNKEFTTDDFPYGALTDTTLSGDRLTIGFFTDGDDALYKVNNVVPIIRPNLEMTNGYIHVISSVLEQSKISGYDWLQEQADYSILAQAMDLAGIMKKLKFNTYTIFAENDSIYYRNGIHSIEDLVNRIATPGISYTDKNGDFYQFAAYHIVQYDYYLNDLSYGRNKYKTLGDDEVTIEVDQEIRINPGLDSLGFSVSESGDTLTIDYIRLVWEKCNIVTSTGPVHNLTNLLLSEPLPENDSIPD